MENGVKLQQNIKNPLLDIFPEKQNKTKQNKNKKKPQTLIQKDTFTTMFKTALLSNS